MTLFQAVAWEGSDVEGTFTVRVYGRADTGKSVSVATPFHPFFYIKVRQNHSIPALAQVLRKHFNGIVGFSQREAIDLWGFQNGKKSRFIRLEFKTHRAMRSCVWVLERIKDQDESWDDLASFGQLKLYEANIDPVLRFMHITNIHSTGWIEVSDQCEPDFDASCDINLFCPSWKTLKPVARDDVAPLRISSFDIECYSSTGDFPTPDKPGDVCFQIGITTRVFGQEGLIRKCLCLKETDGPDCESFATERDMLERFSAYLKEIDPDILTGWNIFGFDLEYLQMRSILVGCSDESMVWGRLKDDPVKLVTKNLSSNALGNNMLKMVPMKGRYVFDLFQDVKREHKLESYSLNNVSKHFLGDQKIDMPVKEIFRRFSDGSALERGEVAEYCLKDTELPHQLMHKLCTVQNLTEMAKACWVPLAFLSERGQQIKVFSQMARKARELGFLIPTMRVDPQALTDDKYEGATVLEAQTGAYYTPITALDFASLYPSIMCAHNLCYSTLVMNPLYDNLPGVVYDQFGPFRFAQAPAPSLLPAILTELKAFRKKAKKDMAAAEKTPMEAVYNGKQLAYKISMNSVYGFTGAQKGMLPLVAIASTVTMRGRQMIEETKNYVEAHFPGAMVRYGDTDSVMVEFDVEGRKGQDAIDYSWELGERAASECTKLFKAPNELELEKVYCPYFLYSKKRYAAKMFVKKGGAVVFKDVDVKGLQVVRRDSCAFVRETLTTLLHLVLDSDDPRPAITQARDAARLLKGGDVPIEKLLMSKQLASSYKVKMPHVEVRDKIRKRAPGSEPQQGDRVSFVVVEHPSKVAKLWEKAEDPQWVIDHSIPIDYMYYFTNQLRKPVCDLLAPLVGSNPEETIFHPVKPRSLITGFFKPLKHLQP
jgi:DNA polymerase delta subunit 1